MLKILANIVSTALISIGLLQPPLLQAPVVGTAIPSSPALIDTYLAAPISTSDTSMVLAKGTTQDNQTLTGYQCFVIDINTPSVEYVCGTASSTSVTSLTRGINLMNPNATSSVNIHSHRSYASVQTTDYPTLQIIVRKLNGTDSFDNQLYYTSYVAPTSSLALAPKQYVDNVISAGGAPATETVSGISILSTLAQMIAGTATSSYNSVVYSLIPQNKYFNQTPSSNTIVPVTSALGKLAQGFLDLTQSFTFSGGAYFVSYYYNQWTDECKWNFNI